MIFSTADIGTWEYYVYSDMASISRVLNGLAMWFNASSGALRAAAGLGGLVILGAALWGAAVKKSSISAPTIGLWLLFAASVGIQGRVHVQNIYTGQTTVVDNVPMIAILPASIFSQAGYKVFTSMETAFQSTSGSYMSVSQNGFASPLEILLSLRKPSTVPVLAALQQSMAQVIFDCGFDPEKDYSTIAPVERAKDALAWFTTNGRQTGLTRVYPINDARQGTVLSCQEAWQYLNNTITNGGVVSSDTLNGMTEQVNQNTTKKNPQAFDGSWSGNALTASFDSLLGGIATMSQDSLEYTKNALLATSFTLAEQCRNRTGALTSPDTCQNAALSMSEGLSVWELEAAGQASGFLKTMFSQMGVLQALFLSLFPVVAIFGLVAANNTTKILGGYVLFGIWSQSWLLVVAPIQAYIQNSIVDEMTKFFQSTGALTMANYNEFYSLLATKLAAASDIMAMTQTLSLALLTGSIYAMAGVAQKMNAADRTEENLHSSTGGAAALAKQGVVEQQQVMLPASSSSSAGMVSLSTQAGAGDPKLEQSLSSSQASGTSVADTVTKTDRRTQEWASDIRQMSGNQLTEQQAFTLANAMKDEFYLNGQMNIAKAAAAVKGMLSTGGGGFGKLFDGATSGLKALNEKLNGGAPVEASLAARWGMDTTERSEGSSSTAQTQSRNLTDNESEAFTRSLERAHQVSNKQESRKAAQTTVNESLNRDRIVALGQSGYQGLSAAELRAGTNELYQDMKDSGRFNQDQITRAEDQARRMMNNWRLDGQMSGEQMDYARNLIASKILNSTDAVGMNNLDQIGSPAPSAHTAYDVEQPKVGGTKLDRVDSTRPTANPEQDGLNDGLSNEERVKENTVNGELVEDSQTTAAISRTGVVAAGVGAGVHGALGAGGAKAAEVAVKTGAASKGAKAFTSLVENLKK